MSKDIKEASAWELEQALSERRRLDYSAKRKAEQLLAANFKATNNFEYYGASDYTGIKIDNLEFYYGYEVTDDNDEWCFLVKEDGIEEMKIPQSQLWYIKDAVMELYLLSGIALYMQSKGLTRRQPNLSTESEAKN